MKKQFRITAFGNLDKSFCAPLIIEAAIQNGTQTLDLGKIKAIGDAQILLYPNLYPNISIEMIGNNLLHVDKKIGDNYETILSVEEIEIFAEITKK